jgi:hypothetical protein
MFITELEMIGMLRSAVRITANKLQIADVDWKSGEELLAEIEEKDRETYNHLRAFLNAYIDWYRFHKRIEQQGKQGHLDREESDELTRLVRSRNETRKAIISRLAAF